ncbi:MAG: hypothetical protein KC620_18990, partial [Myxococcales bacterium]|nr:hypothetical protein [Myxococcales bacterium]
PDQAIVPCEARFASINYTRSVRTLVQRDDRVYAATAGGALTVTAAGVQQTLSVADGLAGNRIAGMTVDPAGRRWLATDRGLTVVRPDGFVFNMHADDEGGGPQGTLRDVAYDPRDPGAGQPPHIWVASDAGLNRLGEDGWTLLGGDVLPSADVRGLYLDDLMRLWVATAGGVVRLADGMVDARFDGLPDIGEFEDVVSADGAGYWVVGTTGLLRIGNDDSVAPEGVYTGFAARDFADDYVATDGGLARIDAASRMLPAGTMPLPSPDVRAVATADEATRWVGTADGLVRLGSYFATYDADAIGGDCATVARRAGDYIFLGTLGGLYVVERDNSLRELEMPPPLGAQVRAILRVGEQVWVGTNNGIAVFTPAAEYVESIIDPIPGPVTDMVNGAPDEVWVGTAGGGLARRGADGQWQTYNQAGAPNQFLSDEILALAYSDGELWVATPLGLSVFQQANGSFGPPVTTQGGRLPTSRVDDVAAGGGRVFAATQAGVAVRAPTGVWTTLRRQVGGIPNEAGTDSARSVVYDGQYLWMALGVSRRLEYGSLVRRSPDPDVRDGLVLIVPEEVGLPLTGAINGVDLGWGSGELIASYCGDGQQPGGFSILGGRSLIEQSVADGLRGQGDMAALTLGPEGRPLAVGATGGGPVADLIRDGAVEDVALPDVPVPPTACGIPAVQGDNLWCVFDGIGFGRRFANNQWNLGRTESIPALGRGELRDIVVETDTVAWLASAEGVVHVNGGSVRALNTAFTGGGLPNDDVRTVALANGRLYAGTAAGVGVLDTGANQWSAIGPDMLPNASVRALAIDSTGAVWIGTDDGLFKRTEDGAGDADYDTSSGLPVNRINDIVMLPGGRVAVATPAGLAVSDGAGAFATHGFADGLPGVAAYELVLDPEGELWVRSDDGVARLITP